MKPSTVLQRARKVLLGRGRWIQNNPACDANGNPVPATDKKAAAFCAIGAIHRVAKTTVYGQIAHIARFVEDAAGVGTELAYWNDHPSTTKKQVLRAFEKAVKLAKEAGQ